MADVDRHDTLLPETRPLDVASRRRSRASHDSAAASTRSWVIMNAHSPPPPPEPIGFPEPVQALAPRPLPEPPRRTASAVTTTVDMSGTEYMAVDVPPAEAGYQWTTGKLKKAKEAHAERTTLRGGNGNGNGRGGFVGGFVSGLKRLPRALVRGRGRPRRGTLGTEFTEGTEGTGMSGNTLPRYASNPPTPVVLDAGASMGFVQSGTAGGQMRVSTRVPSQRAEVEGERLRPSFIVVPPEDDAQRLTPHSEHGNNGQVLDCPEAPMENPYDRDTTNQPPAVPASSPRPSRADHEHADRLAAPPIERGDDDYPVSVHAHPQPTEDYRRMSAHESQSRPHTTINSSASSFSGMGASSPSFSTELHGPIYRFFNALHLMPWVATDRITVDYRPRPKPKEKLGVSWYYPEGGAPPATPASQRSMVDFDPTDSASRSRSAPARAQRSPNPPPRRRRTRSRAATSPNVAPAQGSPPHSTSGYNYPYAYYPAFSPSPPPPSPMAVPVTRRPTSPRSRAHGHGHGHGQSSRSRRRRSATYQPWTPPSPPHTFFPPAPVYVIQATPGASPVLSQASPVPGMAIPASETMGTAGSNSPAEGGRGRGVSPSPQLNRMKSFVGPQMLAPVYMQMQMQPGPGGDPHLAFVPAGGAGSPSYAYAAYSPPPGVQPT